MRLLLGTILVFLFMLAPFVTVGIYFNDIGQSIDKLFVSNKLLVKILVVEFVGYCPRESIDNSVEFFLVEVSF